MTNYAEIARLRRRLALKTLDREVMNIFAEPRRPRPCPQIMPLAA